MQNITFNLQPEKLEDDLVTLIPLQETDFERLFQIASDPLIWEQHPKNDRYKREVFESFFEDAIQSGSSFLVFDTETQEPIGTTRYYDFDPEKSVVAIGYTFLARKYWGGKYNQAMKKLMIDYAFQYVDIILFHIGASNTRSQKAIIKTGAKKLREMDMDYKGKKLPHFEYVIHKQDWFNLPH